MKLKRILFGTMVVGGMLAYQSCNKIEDFGDINQNPNQTTAPITSALLTNVLAGIGNNLGWDQGGLSTVAGLYAQYFSETQYTEASRYAKPTFNFDGYYSGPLYDLQNIINYNSDPNTAATAAVNGSNADQIAIARILKAYYYYMITSLYGDIPYSEALKGTGPNPYDAQQAIFASLLQELTEAVNQFDYGATAIKGDIMYGGDIDSWRRLGNSIRLLIALQMSEADAGTGQTEFNAALNHSAGVIENNSQNAAINYPGGVFNHPVYQYYNITQRSDYAVSETLTDQLGSLSDPRINAYASSNVGFPYGLERDDAVDFANANTNYARLLGGTATPATAEMVLVGAANISLARAEAAQRGWTGEDEATLYAQGIQQSWDQWGVSGNFATYMAQNAVNLGVGNALNKIALQEWLAWFPVGWQAYNVWRRTGVPALTPAPGTTQIPLRFPYGPTQYNLNPDNVQAAAAQYTVGGVADSQFGPLWFDN